VPARPRYGEDWRPGNLRRRAWGRGQGRGCFPLSWAVVGRWVVDTLDSKFLPWSLCRVSGPPK